MMHVGRYHVFIFVSKVRTRNSPNQSTNEVSYHTNALNLPNFRAVEPDK